MENVCTKSAVATQRRTTWETRGLANASHSSGGPAGEQRGGHGAVPLAVEVQFHGRGGHQRQLFHRPALRLVFKTAGSPPSLAQRGTPGRTEEKKIGPAKDVSRTNFPALCAETLQAGTPRGWSWARINRPLPSQKERSLAQTFSEPLKPGSGHVLKIPEGGLEEWNSWKARQ